MKIGLWVQSMGRLPLYEEERPTTPKAQCNQFITNVMFLDAVGWPHNQTQ